MIRILNCDFPEDLNELCIMEIEYPGKYRNNLNFLYQVFPDTCQDRDFIPIAEWLITAHNNKLPRVYIGYSDRLFLTAEGKGIHISINGCVTLVSVPNVVNNDLSKLISRITNCTGEEFTWAT